VDGHIHCGMSLHATLKIFLCLQETWWLQRLKLMELIVNPRRGTGMESGHCFAPDICWPRTIARSCTRRSGIDRSGLWRKSMGSLTWRWQRPAGNYLSPMPGRGYWAKKAAGRPVRTRPNLPSITAI
jgi:hypothetical protein